MNTQGIFKKQQDKIDGVMQNCPIPADVYAWATSQLQKIKMSSIGRRNDTPTLPDIYYTLVLKGIALLKDTKRKKPVEKPEMPEIKVSETWTANSRIVFDPSPADDLRQIQADAKQGKYKVTTDGELYITSVSVAMMRLAIRYRHEWMSSDEIGQ